MQSFKADVIDDVMISIQLNHEAADKAHKHFASGYGDHLSLPGTLRWFRFLSSCSESSDPRDVEKLEKRLD